MVEKAKASEKVNRSGFAELKGKQRELARARIGAILQQAEELGTIVNGAKKKLAGKLNTDVKAAITASLYGSGELKSSFNKEAGQGGDFADATKCGTDGAHDGVAPLYYTFLCLCLQSGGADVSTCSRKLTASQQWSGMSSNTQSIYTEMRKYCRTGHKEQITAVNIRAGIQAVKGFLTTYNTNDYLGYTEAGTCDGSSNNGLCVKHNTHITATTNTFNKLSWIRHLQTAAEALESQATELAKAKAATAVIRSMLKAAWHVPGEISLHQAVATIGPNTQSIAMSNEATAACMAIKKANECAEKTGCKWKGEDIEEKGECKPKK
ncbi:Trypanosomal VSG domain containing protein [Trypanosoma brucei equiperdum]|uniref:Trypanosomal VSG domain containing protein n=1 Tax=Trypanosoma brucei equiperdum TaxID=630700 RepID=A0A3L6L8X1_9TRYP|nr:Trypanosomal VSG domain containing protein [Trypanosoma brucei equiperdum]